MAKKKKMTAKQKREKRAAAEERERRAKARAEVASMRKKIFTVIVCIILVAGLSIPTLALTVCQTMH